MRILLSHHGASHDRRAVEALATALLGEGHAIRVLAPERDLLGPIQTLLRLRRISQLFQPELIYERHDPNHRSIARHARSNGIPHFIAVDMDQFDPRPLRHATRLLPVTAVLARTIGAALQHPPPITVLPNAAQPDLLLPRPFHASPPDRPTIGMVGNSPPPQEAAGFTLVALDDPATDPALLPMLAAACGIGLLAEVALWAAPSALFALMAAGRPIVAPDQPNLREFLEPGRTALLFDPGGWPAAVQRLHADPALAQAIGAAARTDLAARGLTATATARRIAALAA